MFAMGCYMRGVLAGLVVCVLLPAREAKMLRMDEADQGREVTLAVHDIVDLHLAENRTTGFHWDLSTSPDPILKLVLDAPHAAPGPPGKGGEHQWQFEAMQPGAGEIELVYRRSWDQKTAPSRSFKLHVHVR